LKYIRIEIPRNLLSSGIEKVYRGTQFLPILHALEVDSDEVRGHQPDQYPSIQTVSLFMRIETSVPVKPQATKRTLNATTRYNRKYNKMK
jgi:hypothetical protein